MGTAFTVCMTKPDIDRFTAFRAFPELRTNRLVLRELTIADAEWFLEHFSRKEIVQGQGVPAPKGIAEAREDLKHNFIELFKDRDGFGWGIEKKGERDLIGSCGYYKWLKPEGRHAEIGFDLDSSYGGQGIMSEALTAVIDFGFQKMKLNRIEMLVMPRNTRSIRLARKLGFRKGGSSYCRREMGGQARGECERYAGRSDWEGCNSSDID